jgi:hypothetical protein
MPERLQNLSRARARMKTQRVSARQWEPDHPNFIGCLESKQLTMRDILRKSAARMPMDLVKALVNHNDKGVTGICARWHMFQEKRKAVMAIEATAAYTIGRATWRTSRASCASKFWRTLSPTKPR